MENINKVIAGILLFALSACGSSQSDGPSGAASNGERIQTKVYEGVAIDPVAGASFVKIEAYTATGVSTCSGTVVGNNGVVTAAHCFLTPGIQAVTVTSAGRVIPASVVQIAPGFAATDTALLNDVAVVITAEPIGAPPVPLIVSVPLEAGYEMVVYGYGFDEAGGSGVLKGGVIVPDEITDLHIIDNVNGGQNTCQGDSGGPVIAAFIDNETGEQFSGLVGVTSSGTGGSCTNQEIALYSNLQNADLASFVVSYIPDAALF